MSNYLFTEFRREHRPLTQLLNQWAGLAHNRASGLIPADFAEHDDSQLIEQVLTEWQRQAKPLARHAELRPFPEPRPIDRKHADGSYVMHWRWLFKFLIEGNLELLEAWPQNVEIEPNSDDLYNMPTPQMVWELNAGGPTAIFDVPSKEDPDGENPPTGRVIAAARQLDAVIMAINDELSNFQQQLLEELKEVVSKRRRRLGNIDKRTQETIELVKQESPPLELAIATNLIEELDADNRAKHSQVELPVSASKRTFDDLLEITQRWIDASQKYPSTFYKLQEEEITSVLAAALNLTFDTAQREVFVGNGKTDLYIEADLGNRSRAAYIGEAKIWNGPKQIEDHLRQLLGYAPTHIRQVMFLYYIKNKSFEKTKATALAEIERRTTIFTRWIDPGKRVTLKHPNSGHDVDVAILYAHFPERV